MRCQSVTCENVVGHFGQYKVTGGQNRVTFDVYPTFIVTMIIGISLLKSRMATKKITTQVVHTVDEDGVLQNTSFLEKEVFVKDSEEFCILYGKQMAPLLGLDSNEIKVLIWCSIKCALNTNEIVLNKAIKERMMETTKLKKSSVNNALCKLVKKNMLIRPATGVYIVNPETTWRGKINLRDKQIATYTRYTIENPLED